MKRFLRNAAFCFLYEIGLGIALVLSLPKIIKKYLLYGKYKKGFLLRLGIGLPDIPKDKTVIWFHGASVGEVRLLDPLFQGFVDDFKDAVFIVTACTEAGVAEAERLFGSIAYAFIFPLDTIFVMNRAVKKLAPRLVVLSEGDYWFNFIRRVKKLGGEVVVVNAKISETSFKRYLKIKSFARFFFSYMDLICAQDEEYKKRFILMGAPEKRIRVSGNIKLNAVSAVEISSRKQNHEIFENNRIIVLGSTHPSDESLLLPVISSLYSEYRDLKVLIVPRHTERSGALVKEIASYGLKVGLWSAGDSTDSCDIIVVDIMGILSSLYSSAVLAFVGGTFDKTIGGHNLLEPIVAGVPLIFGPHTFSQSLLARDIDHYKAGYLLSGHGTELYADFKKLLDDLQLRETLIENGKTFLKAQHQVSPLDLTKNFTREFISLYKN